MNLDYGSPFLLKLRRVGQQTGLLRPAVRLARKLLNTGYEEAFDVALMRAIREGDTVWDVGANVGLYSRRFGERVGASGRVVAFEPSPGTYRELLNRLADAPQVEVRNVALSDADGVATFYTGGKLSVTDGLFSHGAQDGRDNVEVTVMRGDAVRSEVPDIIKIDVEGFEPEVVRGLGNLLQNPKLRGVFIEVHFQILNERGLTGAAREITSTLNAAGLSVAWLDPSHIAARR